MAEIHFATASGRIRLPVAELTAKLPADQADVTLLDAVRHVGLPLGQSCRGEGVCRSCAVDIDAGAGHLGPESPLERRFGFHDTRRLACQAHLPRAAGSIVLVSHRAWGRPPAADPAAPARATDATLEP